MTGCLSEFSSPEDIATVKSTYGEPVMGISRGRRGAAWRHRGGGFAGGFEEADYVAIRRRPALHPPDRIDAVFGSVRVAAILAVPIVGTLVRVAGSNAIETLRDGLRVRTPAVFRKDILMSLRLDATAWAVATDDARWSNVRSRGHGGSGRPTNIKIRRSPI